MSESISACGGLSWDELGPGLELKKAAGVFCAGEMVDWDAPTGGFLIQASVSMGAVAARAIIKKLGGSGA
jgi:predicted flavoprotein YhiN